MESPSCFVRRRWRRYSVVHISLGVRKSLPNWLPLASASASWWRWAGCQSCQANATAADRAGRWNNPAAPIVCLSSDSPSYNHTCCSFSVLKRLSPIVIFSLRANSRVDLCFLLFFYYIKFFFLLKSHLENAKAGKIATTWLDVSLCLPLSFSPSRTSLLQLRLWNPKPLFVCFLSHPKSKIKLWLVIFLQLTCHSPTGDTQLGLLLDPQLMSHQTGSWKLVMRGPFLC